MTVSEVAGVVLREREESRTSRTSRIQEKVAISCRIGRVNDVRYGRTTCWHFRGRLREF
jgi:hypothetical protein